MRLTTHSLLLLLLAPVACGETTLTERVSVVDSAGVRIVTSPDRDTSPRTVAVEPQFTLGGIEVEGPTQFGYIDNVVVDPAGQIWVSDAQASELRVFSPDGDHIGTLGGAGDGPGEYRALALLGVTPSGAVVASDRRTGRVDWYDRDLQAIRTVQIDQGRGNIVLSPAGDSALLGQLNTWATFLGVEDRERIEVSIELVHWTLPRLEQRRVGEFPSVDVVSMDRATFPFPLTSGPGIGSAASTYVAGPDSYEVRKYSLTGLAELFRIEREPAPVSREFLTGLRASARIRYSGERLTERLELLDRDDLPTTIPTYSRVVVGLDGVIWVQRWDPITDSGSRWDLFASSGEFLGPVELPGGFQLTSATSEVAVGTWHDQYDVPHVRVYRLQGGK